VGITRTYPDNRIEEVTYGTTTTTKGSVRTLSNARIDQVSYPKNLRGF